MDDDTEVLDWTNEDDEQALGGAPRDMDDAEDAISLGGDEDDLRDNYQHQPAEPLAVKGQVAVSNSPADSETQSQSQGRREHQREPSGGSQKAPPTHSSESRPRRTQAPPVPPNLTHALPPKPVVSLAPSDHLSQQTTLASSMIQRERRSNGKTGDEALPPNWEIKHSRKAGQDAYYFNVKTQEATWTRPTMPGHTSPSKERDGRHDLLLETRSSAPGPDIPTRSGTGERGSSSRQGRKDGIRRGSPGRSHEHQHHYRADVIQEAGDGIYTRTAERTDLGQSAYGEVIYATPRAPSPRQVDARRRSRSTTPPRRDTHDRERQLRQPRDLTASRNSMDHSSWNEESRRLVERERFELPPMHDERARGRVPPANVEQRVRYPHEEWSPATRTRSPPPPLREPASNGRRHPPAQTLPAREDLMFTPASVPPGARPHSRFDRPASPPLAASTREFQRVMYPPNDTIPQRRGRDADMSILDRDLDPKRRRVENRPDEYSRRAAPVDIRPSVESFIRSESPTFSPAASNDASRPRKREPLPPQSMRFKEASSRLSPHHLAPEMDAAIPAGLSPRAPFGGGAPERYTDASRDMLLQSRQELPLVPREIDPEGQGHTPPSRVSGRAGSRFDMPPDPQEVVAPERTSVIDIEHTHERMSTLRLQESGRANSGMYADRMDIENDVVPRGPRAMASRGLPVPYPSSTPPEISPSGAYPPPRSFPPTEPPPAGKWSYPSPADPPYAGSGSWSERREEPSHRHPRDVTVDRELASRRFEERSTGASFEHRPQDNTSLHQGLSRKGSGAPRPPNPSTGVNGVPAEQKEWDAADPRPPRGASPVDTGHDIPHRQADWAEERQYRTYNQLSASRARSTSPTSQGSKHHSAIDGNKLSVKPPVAREDGRQQTVLFTRLRRDTGRTQEGRSARVSRFGPQAAPAPPPAPDEPRVWMTREQMQQLEQQKRAQQEAGDTKETDRGRPRTPPGAPHSGESMDRAGPTITHPPLDVPHTTGRAPPSHAHPHDYRSGEERDEAWGTRDQLRGGHSSSMGSKRRSEAQRPALWAREGEMPRKRPRESTPERVHESRSPVDLRSRGHCADPQRPVYERSPTTQNQIFDRMPPPSLPPRPRSPAVFPEPRSSGEYREERPNPSRRGDLPSRWDRPAPVAQEDAASGDPALRQSKPVRIRRPPRLSGEPSQGSLPPPSPSEPPDALPLHLQGDRRTREESSLENIRPLISRNPASLLDRLSDNPSGPDGLASLRDRVDSLPKKPVDDYDTSLDAPGYSMVENGYADDGSGRGGRGGKRRLNKPKRTRRGGVPA